MASAQKKSNSRSGSSSQSGGRKSSGGRSGQGKRAQDKKVKSAPAKHPVHREIGGVVCLLLAFFGAIGYFGMQAAFIDLFRGLLQGLFGYGYYLVPPILLLMAYILFFHRGRPVRLRLVCALSVPVLTGSVLHLLLCREELAWGGELLGRLWTTGQEGTSGGAVSGLIGMAFQFAFSKVGALVLLIVAAALALLFAFNRTVMDLFRAARERRESQTAYSQEEAPEELTLPKPVMEPHVRASQPRRPDIDVPVDDGPLTAKAPTKPVTTIRKKKLFDKVAGVAAPDEVLTGKSSVRGEAQPPEYEDVPEIKPMTDGAIMPVSPAREAAMPPPVVREPAVEKISRQEAQQAHAEVAREIEAGMEQEPQAYRYPPISLLHEGGGTSGAAAAGELQANQQRLQDTLVSFDVDARVVNVTRGPAVTRYELELEQGVKLNKLTKLSDDIALALGVSAVRVAPIPDKISTVGIEVPNRQVTPVAIRDVIGSKAFIESNSKVSFAVGKDIGGNCVVGNIAKLPHMLIAGTTGSGKSVCTNSLIVSLLYKATPEEVRLIMVDPKMVELGVYNGIPHLLIPVVTDPKKAAGALNWAVQEMQRRYNLFAENSVRDLGDYNAAAAQPGSGLEPMPQIVVIIDELADLMMTTSKEVEDSICRLAQKARAAGMHLIIATQRPTTDIITGLIKANIPSRIALSVMSQVDSRTILDTGGAEKLLGHGDMLYLPNGKIKPVRVQGCFTSTKEIEKVVDFIKSQTQSEYSDEIMEQVEQSIPVTKAEAKELRAAEKAAAVNEPEPGSDEDVLERAIEVVVEAGQASTSSLQRRLKLGYARAARMMDELEQMGVIGSYEGAKPRKVLMTKEQLAERKMRRLQ